MVATTLVLTAAISSLLSAAEPSASPSQTIRIFPKLAVGDETVYTIAEVMHGTQLVEGRDDPPRNQIVTIGVRVRFICAEVNETGILVDAVYERIRLDIQGTFLPEPMIFDTTMPGEEAAGNKLAPVILPLIGKPLRLTLSPDGNLVSYTTPEVSLPQVPHIGAGKLFHSERWVFSHFPQIFSLGAEDVAMPTGAFWSRRSTVDATWSLDSALDTRYEFRLEQIKGSDAQCSVSGTGTLIPSESAKLLSATVDEYEVSGFALWDSARGQLKGWDTTATTQVKTRPDETLTTSITTMVKTQIARTE